MRTALAQPSRFLEIVSWLAENVAPRSPRLYAPSIIFEDAPQFASPPAITPEAPPLRFVAPPAPTVAPAAPPPPSALLRKRFLARATALRSNAQNNPAAAIPVFLTSKPAGPQRPTDQKNLGGAIPVYFVAKPAGPPYPNAQNMAGGAIPVRVVASIGTGRGSDQTQDNNAIPIYDAGGPPSPLFGSDQDSLNSSIPVWRTN